MSNELGPCPECAAKIGDYHVSICTFEQCPDCGLQIISCLCDSKDLVHPRLPWTGSWPGITECKEFGWYVVVNPDPDGPRWIACAPGTPGSTPYFNRLYEEAEWDPKQARFVLRSPQEVV
jgi:hypothetical protein